MTLTTSFQKIATGSDTTYGGAKGHLELWAKYNNQTIETNKSNITAELRLVVDYGYIGNYQATYWSISGAVSGSGNLGSGDYRTRTLGSATGDVEHSGDGTKSISLSGSFNPTAWGYSMSVSGSCDLPTIPRASTISSVTTANVGSNPTITVDRKSSSFTHTITYSFGSLSGTIVTKSSLVSITSWTIPSTFYAQMPNNKTKDGTLTITTYSGNTQIGSSSTKTFTVSTKESDCKPIANGTVVDSNSTTIAITGNSSILVAGFSTASVSYTATPRNSASIKTVTVDGSSVYSGTSSTVVSGTKTISSFNANSISIVATDSRLPNGYSDTKTLTAGTNYTLVPYVPLTFNGSVNRSSPTSDILLVSFSGKFYNHNIGNTPNSLTITWKWKESSASSWNNGGTLVQGTDYTINTSNNTYSSAGQISLGSGFDYQKSYHIGIYYTDAIIDTSIVLIANKGEPIAYWGDDFFNINGRSTIRDETIVGGLQNKNLLTLSDDTITSRGITFTSENGIVTTSGSHTGTADSGVTIYANATLKGGTKYYFSGNGTSGISIWYYDKFGNPVVSEAGYQSVGYTVSSDTEITTVKIYSNLPNITIKPQIEEARATSFVEGKKYGISSGTNANGNYIKYDDGTMICWNRIQVSDQAINNGYGSLYQGTRLITFPIPFVYTPTVTCSEFKWGTGASWGTISSVSTSDVELRGVDCLSRATGTTVKISWIAIGRWRA